MGADAETLFRVTWLICHDQAFLHRHREVDSRAWPLGPLRYIVNLALSHYREHRRILTDSVVELTVESDPVNLRRHRTDNAMVRSVWHDLGAFSVEDDGLPAAREMCSTWLQRRGILVRIERAGVSIDRGELEEAEELLRQPGGGDDREAPLSDADLTYVLADTLTRNAKGAIQTGLADLDRAWRGGIRGGEIGMIGAPTGVGKSQMLASFAAAAFWQGKRSLCYTFELTKAQMIERIGLAVLGKGKYDIKLEDLPKELATAARLRHKTKLGRFFVQEGALSWPQLRFDLDAFRQEHGKYPNLLLLDSADDMPPPGKFDQEWAGLKMAYRHMRSLAQELRIPIWTSSQLTKEAVDAARISLRRIAGAYAKATLCHYVLGVSQTPEERDMHDRPLLNIFVLKDSLHGTTGGHLVCETEFGRGENGYPGFEIQEARHFPLPPTLREGVN